MKTMVRALVPAEGAFILMEQNLLVLDFVWSSAQRELLLAASIFHAGSITKSQATLP